MINHCTARKVTRRIAHHQRHVDQFVVDRHRVPDETFFTQVITVVGAYQQQGAVKRAAFTHPAQEHAKMRILCGNLGVVHITEHVVIPFVNIGEWRKPAEYIAVEATHIARRFPVADHVRREPFEHPPIRMVRRMNTHQVDEGKNGLLRIDAAPFDQQPRSIVERFGRIPLKLSVVSQIGTINGVNANSSMNSDAQRVLNAIEGGRQTTLEPLTITPDQSRTHTCLIWARGEQTAVIQKTLETAPQPVVDDAYQRVIAERRRHVSAFAQAFRQRRNAGRERRRRLVGRMLRWIETGKHRRM
jgi:hypothetical protein